MKKMIRVSIIVILFIGCSVQPENKYIDNGNDRNIEANNIEKSHIEANNIEKRKIENNINNDFNKKIKKLVTSKTSTALVVSAISAISVISEASTISKKPIKKLLTRNNSKKVVIDRNTNLMWQDNKNMPKKTWSEAKNHCNNLRFAGFSNWRLPNIDDLLSITDDTRYNPAINKSFKNYHFARFWSSSSYAQDSKVAWFMDFKDGDMKGYYKKGSYYVRCMRDSSL